MRVGYRLRQFWRRLGVRDAAGAQEVARRVLPPAAYALFCTLDVGDQLHAWDVWQFLHHRGRPSPDLAQAALLHDVGKAGAGLTLAHRTLVVLLRKVYPAALEQLARDEPGSWRYPFYVQLRHAELGAMACAQAGCSAITVALVRHHEHKAPEVWGDVPWREDLLALQEADEAC